MSQALGEQSQAEVVDLIVSHVQVNQGFVNGEWLRDCFGAVIGCFVVGQVQRLQWACLAAQVLGNGFTAFERDLVAVKVKDFEISVLKKVLHYNVDTVVA